MGELERSVGDRTRKTSKASDRHSPLLGSDEPLPVDIVNPTGTSPFFFVGDHVGKLIPAALGSLQRTGAAGPRVMLDAHMDELGGVVRRVTPGGFLSMQMLGGWLGHRLITRAARY